MRDYCKTCTSDSDELKTFPPTGEPICDDCLRIEEEALVEARRRYAERSLGSDWAAYTNDTMLRWL